MKFTNVSGYIETKPNVKNKNKICDTIVYTNDFTHNVKNHIEILFSKTFEIRKYTYLILLLCVFFIVLIIIQFGCNALILFATKKRSYAKKEYCRNTEWTTDNELKVDL